VALWRTGLYAIATTLQLMYMLIAMTLNVGLILVIVVTLSACQFITEYRETSRVANGGRTNKSGYSPISAHPTHSSPPFLSAPYNTSVLSSEHDYCGDHDLEMVEGPSTSLLPGSWDKDKARQIMTGIPTNNKTRPVLSRTNSFQVHSPPGLQRLQSSSQTFERHVFSSHPASTTSTSPTLHRRQSGSNATVTSTTDPAKKAYHYHHRSGSSLKNFGAGPGRRVIEGTGTTGRRPLFKIGGTSGEEDSERTTTTEGEDSD